MSSTSKLPQFIKQPLSFLFYTVILVVMMMFVYDFLTRHFPEILLNNNVSAKKNIALPGGIITLENSEIPSLQERVRANEEEIILLRSALANINKNAVNSERYAKFFLIVSNLNEMIKGNNEIDISLEIYALKSFATNDEKLSKIITDISDIKTVYGVQYFNQNFSRVVRKIMKKYYENKEDHPFIVYIKSHVMPYFAYISPEGSRISSILHQAHQQLEAQNMEGFYKLLLEVSNKDANDSIIFKDFMQKLERHVRVASAIDSSKKYVETMLIA